MPKTRVYRYGLRAPTVSPELQQNLEDQLRAAHRYQNKLVEIELERREKWRAIMSDQPEVEAIEAELQRLTEQKAARQKAIKAARAKVRKRAAVPKEWREEVQQLNQQLKELRQQHKAAKKEAKTRVKELNKASDEYANQRVREERGRCGCFWGTYLIVERAVQAAKQSGRDPKFRRWDGNGRLAVQIQKGMTVEELFSGQDTRLQMDPVPESAWDRHRSPEQRTHVRLRVGSEGRAPVWAEWPVTLHRPIPAEARIMWATVKRERLGSKDRWSLHLTLRLPDHYRREQCGDTGAVAVDLGWRKRDDLLRVGYWRDTFGNHDEIILDPGAVGALLKVDDLKSIRAKNFDEMRDWLVEWLRQHDHPEWLRERTSHLRQWRSQARLAAVVLQWRKQRWSGDEVAYNKLEAWRQQDKHLWTWEANQRDQAQNRRREQYRVLAAQLARRYRTLVVEDKFLALLQRRAAVEDERGNADPTRAMQRIASCHSLKQCLTVAFVERGGTVVEVDPAYTTQRCHRCGDATPWDAAKEIEHTCAGCGTTWDQDDNAVHNLLAARENPGGAKKTGGARAKDSAQLSRGKEASVPQKGNARKGARRRGVNYSESRAR